jgi:hypothetical protein
MLVLMAGWNQIMVSAGRERGVGDLKTNGRRVTCLPRLQLQAL